MSCEATVLVGKDLDWRKIAVPVSSEQHNERDVYSSAFHGSAVCGSIQTILFLQVRDRMKSLNALH